MIKQLKKIINSKEQLKYLIKSDFKIRYRNKAIGFLWTVFDPLLMMLVYIILVVVLFKRGGPQFPVLLFSALLMIISRKNLPPSTWVLITVGGLWIAMISGMYYLLSFSSSHDLSWWVTSGLNRMVFPGIILLWLGMTSAVHDILLSLENKTAS